MSAREQADSVSQSRKVFNRSLCHLFLKEKEHWGEYAEGTTWREGRGKGWGVGELYPVPPFPPSVVGCGPSGWLFMLLAISVA